MRKMFAALLIATAPFAAAAEPPPTSLSPELHSLATEARFGAEVPVILTFADQLDPRQFRTFTTAHERRYRMIVALKSQSQDGMRSAITVYLRMRGAKGVKPLWLSNSLAATIPAGLLAELAQWPIVARIRLDAVVHAPVTDYGAGTPAEWNLEVVRAPEVWGLGYTGQGVTVAVLDTGVDGAHPDLSGQYRGGTNSWFDPYGEHATPYDTAGHGTSVTGLIVGRNGSGSAIGLAPNAQWIAAKIFDDNGLATLSAIHQAFQWLLDPDTNPATNDAPDVVNASWGLMGANSCTNEFERDVQALKAAGIAIVFSAGNDGPGASTTVSPGNNLGVLSVGAVDSNNEVALFSSRGPSACDGAPDPELSAPAVSVFTTDTTFGLGNGAYAFVTGTSFAAPHVTGAMALLLSARPEIGVTEIETIVTGSARDLGSLGPDNDTGYGLLDVFAALGRVLTSEAPVATADAFSTAEDVPVTVDVLANDLDPGGAMLTLAAAASPSANGGIVERNAGGTLTYTPPVNFFGTDSFTYQVSNGRLASTGTVTVTVTPVNDAPVAVDEALTITADSATGRYVVAAPGVLANDSDVDGDALSAVLVSTVSTGVLQLQSGGGFIYTPPAGGVPRGPLGFTYRVSDGLATSNVATVSFTLNQVPVARDDTFAFSARDAAGRHYTIAGPGVLANDSDADGDPLGVSLVTDVTEGAVQLAPTGGFTYTPPAGAVPRGPLSFTYQVSDGKALSNAASVTFTVNQAPVARGDSIVLSAASGAGPYTLGAPGVLANDADDDGDSLMAELVSDTAAGALSLDASGAVSYTPPPGNVPAGAPGFSYRASDGIATSNVVSVSIALNRAPAARDDDVTVYADTSGESRYSSRNSVLGNDIDPEGGTLTPVLVTQADRGSVVLTSNGSFVYTPPPEGVPDGPLRFTYQVSDDHVTSNVATVTFSVYGAGDAAPAPAGMGMGTISQPQYPGGWSSASPSIVPAGFAAPRSYTETTSEEVSAADLAPEDGSTYAAKPTAPVRPEEPRPRDHEPRLAANDDDFMLDEMDTRGRYVVGAPGVLANDRGEKITAVLAQNTRAGKVLLAPDGGFVYVPPVRGMPDGELTFIYRLQEDGAVKGEATVRLVPRHPLVAKPDNFVLATRNSRGEFRLDAPGVLANDYGSGALAAVLVQDATTGTVKLAADGGFTYIPPAGGASKEPVSFTYKTNSGRFTSRTATVVFTLRQQLAANPDRFILAAVDDKGRYVLPGPGVLANDTGEGALTAILVRNARSGEVTLAPNGGFVYAPPAGGVPVDALAFSYKASDGKNTSGEVQVVFTLRPASQGPATRPATVPARRAATGASRTLAVPQPAQILRAVGARLSH